MKKFISLVLLIGLVLMALVGCSSNTKNSNDNPQELTNEELEENKETENKEENERPAGVAVYEDVYSEHGLAGAIDYFDTHYNQFTDDQRQSFADSISYEVNERGNTYKFVVYIEPDETPAPQTIENVDWLYPNLFSSQDYSFNLNYFNSAEKEILKQLNDDDVFQLVKAYYIEDYIGDMGFRVIILPNVYQKLKRSLGITFEEAEFGEYVTKEGEPVYGLAEIAIPTEVLLEGASKWESTAIYPIVYLETPNQIELLRDAWKTEALVPVSFVEREQETVSSQPDEGALLDIYETNKEYRLKDLNQSGDVDTFKLVRSTPQDPKDELYLTVNGKNYDMYGVSPDLLSYKYKITKNTESGEFVFVLSAVDLSAGSNTIHFYGYSPNYSMEGMGTVTLDAELEDVSVSNLTFGDVKIDNTTYSLEYE